MLCQFIRKRVITIQIWFNSTRFLCVCASRNGQADQRSRLCKLYFLSGGIGTTFRTWLGKTIFPFPSRLNGILLGWQFSFRFWTKWNSIWFDRKENCHHDHIPFNVKKNGNIVFSVYDSKLRIRQLVDSSGQRYNSLLPGIFLLKIYV